MGLRPNRGIEQACNDVCAGFIITQCQQRRGVEQKERHRWLSSAATSRRRSSRRRSVPPPAPCPRKDAIGSAFTGTTQILFPSTTHSRRSVGRDRKACAPARELSSVPPP